MATVTAFELTGSRDGPAPTGSFLDQTEWPIDDRSVYSAGYASFPNTIKVYMHLP